MGKLAFVGVVLSAAISECAFAEDEAARSLGEQKFSQYCAVCHKEDNTPPLLAPPSFAVLRRYSMEYGEDKDAFVKAIVAWVKAPSVESSLMVGARKKFGLMPAFPYPDKDLEAIAVYLYEANFEQPKNCDPTMENHMGKGGASRGAKSK